MTSRLWTALLVAACITAASAEAVAVPSDATFPRVRPQSALVEQLLEEGEQNSPTFARLLTEIERSDVIVYIEVRTDPAFDVGGQLTFMTFQGDQRFLHVRLDAGTSVRGAVFARQIDLIALLAHELQHALEVADAEDVQDIESFEALYQTIGMSRGRHRFETQAARDTGAQVESELRR